jgi:host factor-I protein
VDNFIGGDRLKKNSINLQDVFLNYVRKEQIQITIYLINGYQLKGIVSGFDNYTIVLENDNKQQMVYKHAISTISPFKSVDFPNFNTINE